jgi:hypothetical protein
MKHADFYAYIYPKNLTEFEAIKIMTPDIANRNQFSIDINKERPLYHTTTIFSLAFNKLALNDNYYYLGLLNSKIMWFFMLCIGTSLRGGYTRFHKHYIENFPLKQLDLNDLNDLNEFTIHNRIITLVHNIMQAKQAGKETFKQETEIDALAFYLYGFTEQEMLDTLLQMPNVSEAERREIQAQYKIRKY